jgi:ribosomal-protein-alanine N-acetyltransferase
MTLEPAQPESADALARVHATSFDQAWTAVDIAELLAAPGGFGLAVHEGGAPLAFILLRAIAGEAEVLTLAVDPNARRRGVARALVEAALLMAQTAGAEAMFLEVAADNAGAIALYAGAGFVRVGARAGYYRRETGAIDALVMRRDLNTKAG